MQHSYDGLDRPGGFSRLNLFAPLRHRDFRLLWAGMTVSLVGDGIFLVAMAWQVYSVWNAPAALSVVGIAMTVPTIVCLLPGGVVSDRMSRRAVMLAADAVRALAIATLAVLSLTGRIQVWEIAVLAMVYGAGTAFFTPSFEALVPDILPASDLPAANSLDQFVRPIAQRLAGPAVGGWIIAAFGPGVAFATDAASFAVAGVAVLAMRSVAHPAEAGVSMMEDIRSGLVFIRRRTWLWGTLVSAAFAYLLFLGPTEVLLPYMVKNGLHGSAGTLGTDLRSRRDRLDRGGPVHGRRAPSRGARSRSSTWCGRWRRWRWRATGWPRRPGSWWSRACSSTRSRPPGRSCGRRSSSATCRPRCWGVSRASTG